MLSSGQLRRRMDAAVAEETTYKAVDAAKKRAVAQRCDVDTFQAMVSAAHLRPMQGGAGLRIVGVGAAGGKPPAPRSFGADGSILAAPAAVPAAALGFAQAAAEPGEEALQSGARWVRAWRAAPSPAGRLRLLERAAAAGALPRLLRLELSTRLLQEVLDCLEAAGAGMAAAGSKEQDGGKQSSGQEEPAAEQPSLAAAVLEAAAGACGFAVARAGLSLQGRQALERLAAARKAAL